MDTHWVVCGRGLVEGVRSCVFKCSMLNVQCSMFDAQGQSAFAKASADKETAVPSRRLSEGIGGWSRVRVLSGGLIRLRQRLWRTKWEWCKLSWLYFLSAYASCKIHFVFFKIIQTSRLRQGYGGQANFKLRTSNVKSQTVNGKR